jgi:hypothetical protein
MQQKQKHILRIIAVSIIFLSGYALWSHTTVDEKNPAVNQNINTNTVDTTNSGDTIDRLKAYSGAETKWGISPFSSGQPLEIDEETQITESTISVKPITIPKPSIQKSIPDHPVFHTSITEWKTRTLSGVTYVFGQGNPPEVALSENEMKTLRGKCGSIDDPDNTGYLCKEQDGYVSPEVEKYLYAALTDPNWSQLLGECYENLSYFQKLIDINTAQQFLDINKWIGIDPNSGRKTFDFQRWQNLTTWILHGTEAWWRATEYPTDINGIKISLENPTCVDIFGKEIYRNLILAQEYYRSAQ